MTTDDLISAMDRNLQITNGSQSMCRLTNGNFLLICDSAGCCDSAMTYAEAEIYLSGDDADWAILR